MPEQLNASEASGSTTPTEGESPARPRKRGALSPATLRHVLLATFAGAVVGGLLGVVWEWVWTPPTGAAWEGKYYLDPEGVGQDVSSTGWFTLIGLVGGIAYGSLAARWGLRRPVATLLGVALGSFLLAYAMYHVGHVLGPSDPWAAARTAEDWEPIVSDLRLAGVEHPMRPFSLETGAVVAPGVGALVGLVGVFLGASGTPRRGRGAHD